MPNAAARTDWGRALRQGQTKGMGDAAPWLQKCPKMQCTKVKNNRRGGGRGFKSSLPRNYRFPLTRNNWDSVQFEMNKIYFVILLNQSKLNFASSHHKFY